MILEGVDLVRLTTLTSQQVDNVTCLECCKYYIAPETAACGHSLCHSCWRGRRSCPTCAIPLERKSLKLNLPLQTLTEHIHQLGESFEKLFSIKLDEFILDTPNNCESESDPTKNVKEWLASSENHFSAPVVSDQCSQDTVQDANNPLEVSSSKIQVHANTIKNVSPKNVVHVSLPQDDWDKIETMPDTEALVKEKENIVGPMDIETYFIEDNKYTVDHPRRSSRKKELFDNDISKAEDINTAKPSSKGSNDDTDKKSNKSKQTWSNVKRMRKEFSKLNKINRNKLNVSIEMCKKTQSTVNKPNSPTLVNEQPIHIDENTPGVLPAVDNKINEPIVGNDKEEHSINPRAIENITEKSAKHIDVIDKQNTTNNEIVIEVDHIAQVSNECKQDANSVTKINKLESNEKPCEKVKNMSTLNKQIKMPFIKKGALCTHQVEEKNNVEAFRTNNERKVQDTDNIEITIKIGNTVANIFIKKKDKDVNSKMNSDKEIQTSLGPHSITVSSKKNTKDIDVQTVDIRIDEIVNNVHPSLKDKSVSTKKHTASADTATAQFEITESVEKELSKIMECKEPEKSQQLTLTNNIKTYSVNEAKQAPSTNNPNDMDYVNDMDIFDSGSIMEGNVHLLKNTKDAASEILIPTVKTMKCKTQKIPDKRVREIDDEEIVPGKKMKTTNFTNSPKRTDAAEPDSENYDAIMSQVFANIDADIAHIHRTQNNKVNTNQPQKETQPHSVENIDEVPTSKDTEPIHVSPIQDCTDQKYSENVFSVFERENKTVTGEDEGPGPTQQEIRDLLTPVLVCNLEATHEDLHNDERVAEKNTPLNEDHDSDKSVVEDTPQKNVSFAKQKQKINSTSQSQRVSDEKESSNKKMSDTQYIKSIINLTDTDTLVEAKSNVTVIDNVGKKLTMETPLTINKFVGDIKHKSTPVARKSLNFDKRNIDDEDPEQTLCPTVEVAKNTQEKEFMSKAFENTPSPAAIVPPLNRFSKDTNNYCIAGSCLSSAEIAKLRYLCTEHKWKYVDKYTKELTHLVVGVDDENKSQRSVKYMCALAAGKWIVSYDWIEKCLRTKIVVNEESFEALDSTGEPGPRRSRLANKYNRKLFKGITFYCMPPFSVLDVDNLKGMVEAAGGTVASQASGVRVTAGTGPALLLAEPEHTQEDRFMYLAMELCIVPVNYEWVLNCLGSYTLGSIQELLLCPASLLPPGTSKWPAELLAREYD